MSEFKIACPACGWEVLCDPAQVGTEIACPNCNATIAVPGQPAGMTEVSAPASVPLESAPDSAPAIQRTSGLAIASLVCSLASLITCVGWLPGIICGHLAKSRIRRNPSLKGSGLATAGLVIGYLILVLEAGTAAVQMWRFSAAVKQGYENVRQDLGTNTVLVAQTESTTASNGNQPIEPVESAPVAAANPQPAPAPAGWTSDPSNMTFPNHPVSGKLHGMDFVARTAMFRNGDLKIRSTSGMLLDVYHLGASIEGQSYEVQPSDHDRSSPHVKITWSEGSAVQTATFNQGYAMKLQFAQPVNRTISGKIYLCFPDVSKSCVAGTFTVRLPKQP